MDSNRAGLAGGIKVEWPAAYGLSTGCELGNGWDLVGVTVLGCRGTVIFGVGRFGVGGLGLGVGGFGLGAGGFFGTDFLGLIFLYLGVAAA